MNQEFWTGRQGWLVLALLSFSCYIAFQGTRGMDNASEGRYAECARAMTASGDYITPTLNGSRILAYLDQDTHATDAYLKARGWSDEQIQSHAVTRAETRERMAAALKAAEDVENAG